MRMTVLDAGGREKGRALPRTERPTFEGARDGILERMDRREELSDFLRTRRARLSPADAGLGATGERRRVPGLRREELAMLAGVSADYYARLEQGRGGVHPSDSVLAALARALRLDEAEHAHLERLARAPLAQPPRRAQPQRVRPEVQRLLDRMPEVPAFVLGRRMDVLAWNELAARLHVDFGALPRRMRNMPRLVFLDDASRQLYPDWERVARDTVAFLRFEASAHPDDAELHALVGELSTKSAEFRRWWARHDVREKVSGVKRYHHPLVGPLELHYETLALPGDDHQTLVTYTAAPGSPSETALRMLALPAPRGPDRPDPRRPA
jgi:transcriptional regulator with XRE-family HTH domain